MKKQTVSLVLGGGGAKGLSHIGAIEAFEDAGYEIRSISGTSIGAIVGGLYAAGKLDAYREWVCSLSRFDVIKLLDPSLSVNGILKGKKIFEHIESISGEIDIETLPIKFSAVATDITNEKEYWFQKGPLLVAMRASMAIPNIFTPVRHNNRSFVDGGVTNPVPVTPTLSDDTDMIFAISLNGDMEPDPLKEETSEEQSALSVMINEYFEDKEDEPLGHLDIFLKSLDIMQHSISRFKLAATPPDLLIEMPENLCGLFDYHKAEALIAYGKERTRKRLKELQLAANHHK